MTGFEPTRLSTLEPETSASAVPPHPHFKFFVLYFYTGRTPEAVLIIELDSFGILRILYERELSLDQRKIVYHICYLLSIGIKHFLFTLEKKK